MQSHKDPEESTWSDNWKQPTPRINPETILRLGVKNHNAISQRPRRINLVRQLEAT